MLAGVDEAWLLDGPEGHASAAVGQQVASAVDGAVGHASANQEAAVMDGGSLRDSLFRAWEQRLYKAMTILSSLQVRWLECLACTHNVVARGGVFRVWKQRLCKAMHSLSSLQVSA